MIRFSAEGGTYKEACDLVYQLKDKGVEANITVGSVAIYCDSTQINMAKAIAQNLGFSFERGYTRDQENVLMQSDIGYEQLIKTANQV